MLDNVGAHRSDHMRELIDAAAASVLYLPPYSPDLNYSELCWSKLKALLREFGARTRAAFDRRTGRRRRQAELRKIVQAAGYSVACPCST